MSARFTSHRMVWLGVGLVVGLVLGGYWPQAPLHGSATAQTEKFAIATGSIDETAEGIFFLDYLTGDLKCAVISPLTGKFLSYFSTSVIRDLNVDAAKNPKFLMVTGDVDFRRIAGGPQWGQTVCYVAEVNSGKVVAYGVPWAKQRQNATDAIEASLIALDAFKFRDVQIRDP